MAHFTPKQITEAAKTALDNWDFEVYAENGETAEQVEARKEALNFDEDYAIENWEDGLDCDDIYDYLEEFSTNMSSAVMRQ